jgi:hypothetical protein
MPPAPIIERLPARGRMAAKVTKVARPGAGGGTEGAGDGDEDRVARRAERRLNLPVARPLAAHGAQGVAVGQIENRHHLHG